MMDTDRRRIPEPADLQGGMAISAVVFDMDGLLLDAESIYKAAWQQASAELGFDLDALAYSRFTGRTTADCERELVHRFGTDFPMFRFRERWRELWRLSVESEASPPRRDFTRSSPSEATKHS
jgi:beta-phosphoglucomutase-like phosphatase (HAD superfamily)